MYTLLELLRREVCSRSDGAASGALVGAAAAAGVVPSVVTVATSPLCVRRDGVVRAPDTYNRRLVL